MQTEVGKGASTERQVDRMSAYPRPTGALEEHAAMARAREIFKVEPYPLGDALVHACGILDVVKGEWGDEWSEHDQRVRAGLSAALIAMQTDPPNMGNVPYPDAAKESE
jgi:hypothetical protein